MASVATWADEIRRQRPNTARWHYANTPLGTAYDAARDCPGDQCVVGALEKQFEILRDTQRSRAARAEALRWVIHLVGDLHQPLHCADKGDRGGNALEVRWFKRKSNLHRVWDSDVVAQAGLSTPQLVAAIRRDIPPDAHVANTTPTPWDSAEVQRTLVAWTNESGEIARRVAYALPPDGPLSEAYYERAAPAVRLQLARAGRRLAALLNSALARRDTPPAPPIPQQMPPAADAACVPREQCCKVCSTGQACGASCISRSYTCHVGPGCACDAVAVCSRGLP